MLVGLASLDPPTNHVLTFLHRPADFATVLSVVVTLAGGIAYYRLPLTQYPPVTPPTVRVRCTYPGASADVVAQSVAAPSSSRSTASKT